MAIIMANGAMQILYRKRGMTPLMVIPEESRIVPRHQDDHL
jgi:hypothetical protein